MQPLNIETGTHVVCELATQAGSMEIGPHQKGLPRTAESGMLNPCASISESSVTLEASGSDHGASSSVVSLLDYAKADCSNEVSGVDERYQVLQSAAGMHGPQFQTVERVWTNDAKDAILARIRVPSDQHSQYYIMHPAALDGALQLVGWMQPPGMPEGGEIGRAHV